PEHGTLADPGWPPHLVDDARPAGGIRGAGRRAAALALVAAVGVGVRPRHSDQGAGHSNPAHPAIATARLANTQVLPGWVACLAGLRGSHGGSGAPLVRGGLPAYARVRSLLLVGAQRPAIHGTV